MSFSDELKAFRTDPASRRIIERWRKFGGVDAMWAKVLQAEDRHLKRADRPLAARLSPKEFIHAVLSARYGVERLIAHELNVKVKFKELKVKFAECIEAADSPREIEDAISEFRSKFDALDRVIFDWHASTAVSRQNKNGSRTEKAFAQHVQNFLQQRCHAPLDDVVTELLDIVFPGKHHSQDDARNARRPTTRAARKRQHQATGALIRQKRA